MICSIRYNLLELLRKKVCKDIIMPMTRHCMMPYVSDSRRGTGTLNGGENRLLFKDGRMSTKETTLNGNYAFSNTVVKFCGIFTRVICKQHKIKNRGITF